MGPNLPRVFARILNFSTLWTAEGLGEQSKTGAIVAVPAPAEFKRLLDIVPRVSPTICINERTGRPWSKYDFAIEFREIVTLSGLPTELQFRDLRRTAVVRLAEAGCSEAEIVAIPVPPSPVPR